MKIVLRDIVYETSNSFIELTIREVDGEIIAGTGYVGENLYGDAMFFQDIDESKLNEPGKNVMVSNFKDNATNKIYVDINDNKSTKNVIKETCSLLNTMAIFERENAL